MHCNRCRAAIAALPAKFCGACGEPIATPAAPHATIAQTMQMRWVVGRGPNAAVRIDSPEVSVEHAALSIENGQLIVTDLGSRNGTFVAGQRVSRASVVPSDRVAFATAPMPWDHPAVRALCAQLASAPRVPPTVAFPALASPSAMGSSASNSSAPAPAVAVPRAPKPRSLAVPLVVVGASALVLMLGVGVVALVSNVIDAAPDVSASSAGALAGQVAPMLAAAPVAAPVIEPTGPLFTVDEAPKASGLYAERIIDQVDPRGLEQEAQRLRFRLRSTAMQAAGRFLGIRGSDHALPAREAWAVPMGSVRRAGREYLAVMTTRCVVDYRYPMNHSMPRFANLALFTAAGRQEQVYRLDPSSIHPDLTGVDQQGGWYWGARHDTFSNPAYRARYMQLAESGSPLVQAELPVGDWNGNTGVDLLLLYFPSDEPGTSALRAQGRDHLGVRDPVALVRSLVAGRTASVLGVGEFSLVSNDCMHALQQTAEDMQRETQFWRNVAVGTIAASLVVLVGAAGIATGGPGALIGPAMTRLRSVLSPMGTGPLATALRSTTWRAAQRILGGDDVRDIAWDEAGRMVLSLASNSGAVERFALAGVRSAGLTPAQGQRVIATTRALLRTQGTRVVRLNDRATSGVASVMLPDRQLDLSAELLRRGHVQLAIDRPAEIGLQRGLILAARDALLDPQSAATAITQDPNYRAQLQQVLSQVGP